jgi:hypothetical protein
MALQISTTIIMIDKGKRRERDRNKEQASRYLNPGPLR